MHRVPVTRQHLSRHGAALHRLFDDVFASDSARVAASAVDIEEGDKDYNVSIDVPGDAKDDVKVSSGGRRVVVEAGSKREEERKDGERVLWRAPAVAFCARPRAAGRTGPGCIERRAGKRRPCAGAR